MNFTATKFYNRYTQVEEEIKNHSEIVKSASNSTNPRTYNSTQAHLEFWKNAIQVIKRNLIFGVGTGDIKEEMVKQYASVNFQYGVENRFSPHNQYLHTGVILGLAGVILLLCCILLPLRAAVQQQDWMYACFLLIIMFNAITESILERQNGIIFYAFFNVLFYIQGISKSKNEFA